MKFTITCPNSCKTSEVSEEEIASTKLKVIKKVTEQIELSDIIRSIENGDPEKYLCDGSEVTISLRNGKELVLQIIIGLYEEGQVIFVSKDMPF